MYAFFTQRSLLSDPKYKEALSEGGFYLWNDLTIPDEQYIFPVVFIVSSLILIQKGFQIQRKPASVDPSSLQIKTQYIFKYFLMGCTILSFLFVKTLPNGLFIYWISSNILTIIINTLTQHKMFLDLYNCPSKDDIDILDNNLDKRRLYNVCILLNIPTPNWNIPPSIAKDCLQNMTKSEKDIFIPILDTILGISTKPTKGELAATINRNMTYIERIQQQHIYYTKLMRDMEQIRSQLSSRLPIQVSNNTMSSDNTISKV